MKKKGRLFENFHILLLYTIYNLHIICPSYPDFFIFFYADDIITSAKTYFCRWDASILALIQVKSSYFMNYQ
jgi:hypothetical protein